MLRGLHRILAGSDGPGKSALPAGEFLHPAPLLAVIVLFVNDHLLKGANILPPVVTGKLSDFAGLLFFPLLCTAAIDTALLVAARLGAPVDFSLRRYKLAIAIIATSALFCAIKLSPAAARSVAAALSAIGMDAQIVPDHTDLIALGSVFAAYWLGTREIARVPLGRLEAIARARQRDPTVDVRASLDDVVACGALPERVDMLAGELVQFWDGGPPDDARTTLGVLRNADNSS